METTSENREIKFITAAGLVLNLVLSAVKFVLGRMCNSRAVVADAVHSLSDSVTDIAVIIGSAFWGPPADKEHPYGHRKIETAVTFLIGLLLAVAGFDIGSEAVLGIAKPRSGEISLLAVAGPLLSIIVKEIMYRWNVAVGKRLKSPAMIANAWHHRSDALSSIPAAVSVVLAWKYPEFWFVDLIGALIVSIFIIKVAWDIALPAFHELIESGAGAREIEQIEKIALSTEGVHSVHKIRTRRMSGNIMVDLHVLVDPSITVCEGHNISGAVKKRLIEEGPEIADVIVHIEPYEGKIE